MCQINKLDIFIAQLIEADYYLQDEKKSSLSNQLLKYVNSNSLLQVFYFLDNIKNNDQLRDINCLNTNEIKIALNGLVNELTVFKDLYGLSRNSRYILEDGQISVCLPSHYKFDRALANILSIHSDSINKENLIVPKYTNTIRVYLDFAVLEYKPTFNQLESLIALNIQKYFIFNECIDSIFHPLFDKLPNFVSVQ